MNTTELVRFHLAHSHWAIDQILDHLEALPSEAINRDMGIGPGSLCENIAHTLEAMFFFADNFAGREYVEREGFSARAATVAGLRGLLVNAQRELSESMLAALGRGLGERVQWPNAEAGTLPSAAAVAQVFDHAVLHRTQCINMLKRLGVTPVPDLDPMTFQAMGRGW